MKRAILIFDNILERFSRLGLISILFLILILAVSSILLRWIGLSPLWLEPFIRHLVFLSAFLGGSIATSKGVHIKVDLLTHFVEKSPSKIFYWLNKNLVTCFCFLTSVILTKASWDFYLVEKEFGASAFLKIHSSYLVGIIPFGMLLISLRFFNRFIIGLIEGDNRGTNRI